MLDPTTVVAAAEKMRALIRDDCGVYHKAPVIAWRITGDVAKPILLDELGTEFEILGYELADGTAVAMNWVAASTAAEIIARDEALQRQPSIRCVEL